MFLKNKSPQAIPVSFNEELKVVGLTSGFVTKAGLVSFNEELKVICQYLEYKCVSSVSFNEELKDAPSQPTPKKKGGGIL